MRKGLEYQGESKRGFPAGGGGGGKPDHVAVPMRAMRSSHSGLDLSAMNAEGLPRSPHEKWTIIVDSKIQDLKVMVDSEFEAVPVRTCIELAKMLRERGRCDEAFDYIDAVIAILVEPDGDTKDLFDAYCVKMQVHIVSGSDMNGFRATFDLAQGLCSSMIQQSMLHNLKASMYMLNNKYELAKTSYCSAYTDGISSLEEPGGDRIESLKKICRAYSNFIELCFIYSPRNITLVFEPFNDYLNQYAQAINDQPSMVLKKLCEDGGVFEYDGPGTYGDCTLCFALGNRHLYLNEFEQARKFFRQAQGLRGYNPSSYYLEGLCYVEEVKASESSLGVIEKSNLYATAIDLFSKAFLQKHNPEYLVSAYREAIKGLWNQVIVSSFAPVASGQDYNLNTIQLFKGLAGIPADCYLSLKESMVDSIWGNLKDLLSIYIKVVKENHYSDARTHLEAFIKNFGDGAEIYQAYISDHLAEVYKTGRTSSIQQGEAISELFNNVSWLDQKKLNSCGCAKTAKYRISCNKAGVFVGVLSSIASAAAGAVVAYAIQAAETGDNSTLTL